MKKGTREVKEYTTGNKYPKDTLFAVKEGSSNKYFFSEEAYKKWRLNADYLKKIKDHISYNLLGYTDSGSPFNAALIKKIKAFEDIGYDAFYETLIRYDGDIQNALSKKDFGNSGDYNRISYIVAIVNGHIRDMRKILDEKRKRDEYLDNVVGEVIEDPVTAHKPKPVRDWLD